MRNTPNVRAERHRTEGPAGSNNGFFLIPRRTFDLHVMVGDGLGWDHVSVSVARVGEAAAFRIPDYDELTFVKELFFRDDETVMHLWVPAAQHVNVHPHVLHLWRPQSQEEIDRLRQEWQEAGETYDGDGRSPGVIPRPPQETV
jgi:hypothetical protein